MATTRIWLGVVLIGLACGSAAVGQTGTLVPQSTGGLRKLPPPPGEPAQPAAATDATAAGATDVLTGQPTPPGTYEGPWSGPNHAGGCCGPIGGNGPITYELVDYTGPNLPTAGGILSRRLQTGWTVGGSANSLFFDCSGDAAWVLGLGISYTYNRGQQDKPLDVYTNTPPLVDNNGSIIQRFPDQLNEFVIRGLHRTSFNFSIGRDWFLDGPGINGIETGANWRFGTDLGGRWGTAHVDLVPTADLTNYFKKGSTTYGLFGGFHLTREIPFGATILYAGFRTEFGYDWTNVIPPQGGDIFNINFFLNGGIRF
ncbi:MAG TPA: hypothetical protein VGJ05_06955 [Fimbriiglobus sp.]|jgi:hypothetical protein